MFNFLWDRVAQFLVNHPNIRDRLILRSFDYPHRTQLGEYMSRWWLFKRRPWLPFALRIHNIKLPDHDRDLHNHPGTFRTIMLCGWYVEERGGQFLVLSEGESRLVSRDSFHRIAAVSPNGCLTLVIEWGFWGKRWGFLTEHGYVEHEDYLG